MADDRGGKGRMAFLIGVEVVLTILRMIPWGTVADQLFRKTTTSRVGPVETPVSRKAA